MFQSIWFLLGLISLVLGVIGLVLPLLPTTPFILLAAMAFAKSSPRLHHWLINHSHLGRIIKNWDDGGRIDKRSKTIALTLMALMPVLSYALNAPLWAIGVQTIILLTVAVFIVSRPD